MAAFSGLLLLGSDFSSINFQVQLWTSTVSCGGLKAVGSGLDRSISNAAGLHTGSRLERGTFVILLTPPLPRQSVRIIFTSRQCSTQGCGWFIGAPFHISLIIERSMENEINQNHRLFYLLLSIQMVFYLTYSPSFEQGFLLGLSILFLNEQRRLRQA
jgi:hypothetical protein